MKKRKIKNKKKLKLNNNLQTMRNVLEGDRIYHLMAHIQAGYEGAGD